MAPRYSMVPVGYVRSPFREPAAAPHQGRDTGVEVVIEIEPRYREALEGLEEWEAVQVICWFHLARRDRLKVHPRGNTDRPLRGVFATRSPIRPNPLALYTAQVVEVTGDRVRVRGVDAVDGTPVVDIRPHIPRLDD